MKEQFSKRMSEMKPSTIREILKVTERPDFISFAGGLPAPELFPVEEVRASAGRALRDAGPQALQYGVTEGIRPLREKVAAEMGRRGVRCVADDILITTGSQQSIDLLGKIFLDPGDVVFTENPTYLAAIQAFQFYGAKFVPVPTDEDGLIPEALDELIPLHRPKFLYTIPNFQNPTGRTLSEERRVALYRAACRHGLTIIEDDPYGKLRYRGTPIRPVKAYDEEGLVVSLSTFSKVVAPGIRMGWVVCSQAIREQLIVAKQAADLHSSSLDQVVLNRYLSDYDNDAHVEKIRAAYGERFDVMDAALTECMPEGFRWTHPEGGMFLWVTGPEGLDTNDLLLKALERKVVFVPGRDFFPDGSGCNCLRLNFSNSTPDTIREGVSRLAEVLEGCGYRRAESLTV
jgi:2-aminoadipate transaminase